MLISQTSNMKGLARALKGGNRKIVPVTLLRKVLSARLSNNVLKSCKTKLGHSFKMIQSV